MPNKESIVSKIGEAIWRQIIVNMPPEIARGCAVTNVTSQSFNHEGLRVPFIRIYSGNKLDYEVAKKLLMPIKLPGVWEKKRIEFVLLADA